MPSLRLEEIEDLIDEENADVVRTKNIHKDKNKKEPPKKFVLHEEE